MSYYILNPQIALRSWQLVPYAYYIKGVRNARGLKKEEFEFLLQCDGKTELAKGLPLAEKFLEMGYIAPAKDSDTLSEWQKHLDCDNRYFPAMNWMLTGKCNYNCRHCFNAADNTPLMSEWTLKEAIGLIEQAQACGIHAFTITGGEPMVHKNFFEIIENIYTHGMYVEELNTNGSFLDQAAFDQLRKIGCAPLIKISFDGIGHHDWLRNRKGAEADALRAIRLCVENGFRVKVQTNVHRLNIESLLPTAELLDEMGVDEMRVIRTSESPRWKENAGGACLELEEYYENMLEFISRYALVSGTERIEYGKPVGSIQKKHKMDIDIWQFLTLFPQEESYWLRPVEYAAGEYRASMPVCRGTRGMVAVAADGNVYPCMQMSGYYSAKGEFMGNVKNEGLQPILQKGKYLSEVCTTVGQLSEHNPTCAACPYFKYCGGGCRVLAIALTGDKFGIDPAKCLFFQKGWHRKIAETLRGWKNIAPLEGG